MSEERPDDRPEGPDVGSVGEEALKLFGALSDWARDHGSQVAEGLADHATSAVQGVADGADRHLATGAAECTWCPVCRTVHTLRQASPEVRAQLSTAASAASTLLQAVAGLLETGAEQTPRRPSDRPSGVERIDLDPGTDP